MGRELGLLHFQLETQVPRSWRTEAAGRDGRTASRDPPPPRRDSGDRREKTSDSPPLHPGQGGPRGSRDALFTAPVAKPRGCGPVRRGLPPGRGRGALPCGAGGAPVRYRTVPCPTVPCRAVPCRSAPLLPPAAPPPPLPPRSHRRSGASYSSAPRG